MAGHKIPVALYVLSALGCSHGFSAPAEARLVKLEITAKQEYGTFRPGPFVHWQGRVVGELQPTEVIPDLDKAARNARGLVGYAARVSLLMPANPKNGNGVLLVDIPNRGRPYGAFQQPAR